MDTGVGKGGGGTVLNIGRSCTIVASRTLSASATGQRMGLEVTARMGESGLVRAYVDETGDRGVTARSSKYFAMAGIVVADEDEHLLRTTVQQCRTALKVPLGRPLHWQDHVKKYARRQFVAAQFGRLPGLMVNFVVFEKAAIPATSQLWSDQTVFYNYAAGLTMERLLLTARDWPGGPRRLVVRFGHVRGFDHNETNAYFSLKRGRDPGWVPWRLLQGDVKFVGTGSYDGIQAADQYAGMLNAALCPDEFGGYEPHHLLAIRHQIRRRDGNAWGCGFKILGQLNHMNSFPWWPPEGI